MSEERDHEGEGASTGARIALLVGGLGSAVIGIMAFTGADMSLPGVFIGLSAVMAVLGLIALWQSLRTAFGGGPRMDAAMVTGLPDRRALLDEKATLLRAIKDIAFEREVGKISTDDFDRLNAAYRRRAKEVLRLLDQDIEPYKDRAARLVREAMGELDRGAEDKTGPDAKKRGGKSRVSAKSKKKARVAPSAPSRIECRACGTSNDADAAHCKECGSRLGPLVCPKCETENDEDAKFCKSCATDLRGVARSSSPREETALGETGRSVDAASSNAASEADDDSRADDSADDASSDDASPEDDALDDASPENDSLEGSEPEGAAR